MWKIYREYQSALRLWLSYNIRISNLEHRPANSTDTRRSALTAKKAGGRLVRPPLNASDAARARNNWCPRSDSFGGPLATPSTYSPSIIYPIPTQEADDAPMTPLDYECLQTAMIQLLPARKYQPGTGGGSIQECLRELPFPTGFRLTTDIELEPVLSGLSGSGHLRLEARIWKTCPATSKLVAPSSTKSGVIVSSMSCTWYFVTHPHDISEEANDSGELIYGPGDIQEVSLVSRNGQYENYVAAVWPAGSYEGKCTDDVYIERMCVVERSARVALESPMEALWHIKEGPYFKHSKPDELA
ncbi:hypothetical protein EVAR_34573_1 [Eumeta japonica]|uniref:Uncharacterized protein n=1 Tax=Eumeta variegata TaxID=151549 RepID=A0A4C1Z8Z1_EUMVA|nr:hypothetical protein EVAR_34573_1 [Eumeta japonica]